MGGRRQPRLTGLANGGAYEIPHHWLDRPRVDHILGRSLRVRNVRPDPLVTGRMQTAHVIAHCRPRPREVALPDDRVSHSKSGNRKPRSMIVDSGLAGIRPRPEMTPQCCCEPGNRLAGSTFTPGPMVEEIATRLMK